MQNISINIVVTDNYWESRYCIENLLSKTTLKPKIYIIDNGSKDDRVEKWSIEFCKEHKGYFKRLTETVSLEKEYNAFLKAMTLLPSLEDYICLLPCNLLVHQNWLESLYSSYTSCEDTGIVSIRTGEEKIALAPILHKAVKGEDYLDNVWLSDNNSVEGLLFFKSDLLNKIGYFDENLNAIGFNVADFCFRASATGHKNFYTTKQTCVKTQIENELLFPAKTEDSYNVFKNEVERMVREQNYQK